MSSFKVLLVLLLCYCVCGDEINHLVFKYKIRDSRFSPSCGRSELTPFYRKNILENPFYLICLIFLGILFILMFLGIIKGLIGLCCSKNVGEFGLALLVDLPKPLDEYQERELKDREVCYDVGGWPVHPDTCERTVRVLPKRTEFCLNVVFFMAYPLALILQLCALCCCITNYNENNEARHFKSVNIIKCNEGYEKKGDPGQKVDMYRDNDSKEDEDTRYVISQMKLSRCSLQR